MSAWPTILFSLDRCYLLAKRVDELGVPMVEQENRTGFPNIPVNDLLGKSCGQTNAFQFTSSGHVQRTAARTPETGYANVRFPKGKT